MIKLNKLLALLLALVIAAAMFVSCKTTGGGTDTTTGDSNTTNDVSGDTSAGGSDTLPVATDLHIILNNVSNAKVIRDENKDSASEAVICATDIRKAIGDATGVAPGIDTDWTKDGKHDPNAIEILVGSTNYEESRAVLSELTYGQYAIKVVGNKLVVAAYSDTAIRVATNQLIKLIRNIAAEGSLTIPADTFIADSVNKDLGALPTYEGGTFSTTYASGGDATLILIKNTNTDDYQNYLKKLTDNGYTEYTTSQITDNHFATYTNKNFTVSAGFYKYENSARIIIEPLANPVGLESDNKYTAVTTSQITMFGLAEKNASGAFVDNNGLCILIRLDDGRFIIIDGGFNRASNSSMLIKALKEQSADYIKSGEKITIAAWIITHPHGDHSGMIGGQYGAFKPFNVERFLVSFISETERLKAINYYASINSTNWGSNEGSGFANVEKAAAYLGAYVHQLRVGQTFYLANVKMEVLYTIDSFAPNICNAFNTTSNVIKMTFSDGTVYMSTGDATGNAMQICAKMYGTYLKTDLLQITHHGYTTWGNDAGVIAAHRLMAPSTLMWPVGTTDYSKNMARTYNIVLYDAQSGGSNTNFKESYVSGELGDTVVVPIPFKIGNVTVTRVYNK